jgi:hypothetical protein
MKLENNVSSMISKELIKTLINKKSWEIDPMTNSQLVSIKYSY